METLNQSDRLPDNQWCALSNINIQSITANAMASFNNIVADSEFHSRPLADWHAAIWRNRGRIRMCVIRDLDFESCLSGHDDIADVA